MVSRRGFGGRNEEGRLRAEEKHIISIFQLENTGVKGLLLNWERQGDLPDFLPYQKFPRGGRNHKVSL